MRPNRQFAFVLFRQGVGRTLKEISARAYVHVFVGPLQAVNIVQD